MQSSQKYPLRISCLMLFMLAGIAGSFAGVSRSIQEQYKRDYENKAIFLKIPVYGLKQVVTISGQTYRVEPGSGEPRFKVGDQLRILLVDFGSNEVKFRLGAIAASGFVEIGFRFDADLQDSFPNRDLFDKALQSTFTEGLKYTDIEDAKQDFVKEQFERSVREIAVSASISRESVLKNIAPNVPAFQEAQHEIDTLKNRLQDISAQLSQSQSENRKRDAELKNLQSEYSRLKSSHAALQEKIDSSESQVSKLGDELRDARGTARGYQKELASLQRSLNLKVDAGRDLSMQIAELGQVMRKLQKDNDALGAQAGALQTDLSAQRAANARLVSDNEELKSSNRQMQSTIGTLTSKEDSLAKQYLDLKKAKEKLDDYAQSVRSLRTRVVEEKTEGGFRRGKAQVYLRNTLLGTLDWSFPAYLNHNADKSGGVNFSAESIDFVRVTPEERHILGTLGERLKMRVDLVSGSATMLVKPEQGESVREIGERDRSSWSWSIRNQGTQDAELVLTARLINRNSDEIGLLQQQHAVNASNAVRQLRGYLHPVPLAVGAILGFMLFGIVGVFRRSKRIPARENRDSAHPPDSHSSTGRTKL